MFELTSNEIVIKITAEIDEFKKSMGAVLDDISSFSTQGKKLSQALIGIGAAGTGSIIMFTKFAKEAAKAQDIQQQFNKVVGIQGVKVLEDMQEATLGTIDKFELMSVATETMLKGLDVNMLPVLSDYAMRIKDAGITTASTTDIINSITQALITGRTAQLASLGIIIDTTKAYDEYKKKIGMVEGELTDLQKKQALQPVLLAEIASKMNSLAAPTIDTADKLDILNVKFTELKLEIGSLVAEPLNEMIDTLSSLINKIDNMPAPMKEVSGELAIWGSVGAVALGILGGFSWALLNIIEIGGLVAPVLAGVSAALLAFVSSPIAPFVLGLTLAGLAINDIKSQQEELNPLQENNASITAILNENYGQYNSLLWDASVKSAQLRTKTDEMSTAYIEEEHFLRLASAAHQEDIKLLEAEAVAAAKAAAAARDFAQALNDAMTTASRNTAWHTAISALQAAGVSGAKGMMSTYGGGVKRASKKQFGGLITTPTITLAGEAGPERIVPVGRPHARSAMNEGYGGGITINIGYITGVGLTVEELAEQFEAKLRTMITGY
jgi:hypothetical protein